MTKDLSTALSAKEIYAKLRVCSMLRITTKVYKDWILSDKNVVGFVAHVNSNLGKQEKLEKIRSWIKERNLPLEVFDQTSHLTRFKIVIKR
jgi:hypothetical protein